MKNIFLNSNIAQTDSNHSLVLAQYADKKITEQPKDTNASGQNNNKDHIDNKDGSTDKDNKDNKDNKSKSMDNSMLAIIIGGSLGGAALLGAIIATVVFCLRSQKKDTNANSRFSVATPQSSTLTQDRLSENNVVVNGEQYQHSKHSQEACCSSNKLISSHSLIARRDPDLCRHTMPLDEEIFKVKNCVFLCHKAEKFRDEYNEMYFVVDNYFAKITNVARLSGRKYNTETELFENHTYDRHSRIYSYCRKADEDIQEGSLEIATCLDQWGQVTPLLKDIREKADPEFNKAIENALNDEEKRCREHVLKEIKREENKMLHPRLKREYLRNYCVRVTRKGCTPTTYIGQTYDQIYEKKNMIKSMYMQKALEQVVRIRKGLDKPRERYGARSYAVAHHLN